MEKYKNLIVNKSSFLTVCVFLLLVVTYLKSPFDHYNTVFEDFSKGSELLAIRSLTAGKLGLPLQEYGLIQKLDSLIGTGEDLYGGEWEALNFAYFSNGISSDGSSIAVKDTDYTRRVYEEGGSIRFINGDEARIINVVSNDEYKGYLEIKLDSKVSCTSLEGIRVYSAKGAEHQKYSYSPYKSQVGVQGYFSYLCGKYIPYGKRFVPYLFCCAMMALVVLLIVNEIKKKYNFLMALVFLGVFWLSPWIVNYARNLYWVEFTWFVPMLIGLFCANNIDNKRRSRLCFGFMYLAVLLKCLCGYEFISVIMLGGIFFLISDWLKEILMMHDYIRARKFFFLIVKISLFALLGFLTALIIHSFMRGEGNFFAGLIDIFERDILRRTLGGNAADFPIVYADSLNASVVQVIELYLRFNTQIVLGMDGELFPMLMLIPILLFIWDWYKSKVDYEEVSLYFLSLITCVSWFILGKAHSDIHVHLNYVCWYFGYVQICIYCVVKHITKYCLCTGKIKTS